MKPKVALALLLLALSGCGSEPTTEQNEELATAPGLSESPSPIASTYAACSDSDALLYAYEMSSASNNATNRSVLSKLTRERDISKEQLFATLQGELVTYSKSEDTLTVRKAYAQLSDGEYSISGLAAGTALSCILSGLEIPERVTSHMSSTRALDGTQNDAWDAYEARWTYHPDDGLNLTLWSTD